MTFFAQLAQLEAHFSFRIITPIMGIALNQESDEEQFLTACDELGLSVKHCGKLLILEREIIQ